MKKYYFFIIGVLILHLGFYHESMGVEINIGSNNQVTTGKISGVSGCLEGSGKLQTDKRSVKDFSEIHIDGVFTVHITVDSDGPILISADDNLLKIVKTSVENGRLSLTTTKSYCTQTQMTVEIPVAQLSGVIVDGSSEVSVAAGQKTIDQLEIALNGTSTMTLTGSGVLLAAQVKDTAELDASGFSADHVQVVSADATVARFHVQSRLEGQGSDASEIHFSGNPSVVAVQVSDAAELIMEE